MSLQLSIFDDAPPPAARRRDPDTSHAAAASAKELQGEHHRTILACLEQYGCLGKDGIAARARLTSYQVSKRLSELARTGQIVETGRTVPSTAGRQEREWKRCCDGR